MRQRGVGDDGDRRKVIVTLVPEAVAAAAAHYRGYGEHLERVLSRRDAAELRTIARFLADLVADPSAPLR